MAIRTGRVARALLVVLPLLLPGTTFAAMLLVASATASRDAVAFVRVTTSLYQQHRLSLATISSHSRLWITSKVWQSRPPPLPTRSSSTTPRIQHSQAWRCHQRQHRGAIVTHSCIFCRRRYLEHAPGLGMDATFARFIRKMHRFHSSAG